MLTVLVFTWWLFGEYFSFSLFSIFSGCGYILQKATAGASLVSLLSPPQPRHILSSCGLWRTVNGTKVPGLSAAFMFLRELTELDSRPWGGESLIHFPSHSKENLVTAFYIWACNRQSTSPHSDAHPFMGCLPAIWCGGQDDGCGSHMPGCIFLGPEQVTLPCASVLSSTNVVWGGPLTSQGVVKIKWMNP